MNRKPHREICSLCHEVSRVGFHVPDEVWAAAVHLSEVNSIVCLRCFTRLADERGVEWDRDITFAPVSWVTHERNNAREVTTLVRCFECREDFLLVVSPDGLLRRRYCIGEVGGGVYVAHDVCVVLAKRATRETP